MKIHCFKNSILIDYESQKGIPCFFIWISIHYHPVYMFSAPEIYISPVPDIVSGSRQFVLVTRNSCRSSVYAILLKFENLPVIVTGRKRILSVTHEIVPDSDRWPAVISCTGYVYRKLQGKDFESISNFSSHLIRWLINWFLIQLNLIGST